jgi:hypothetical protein
MSTVSLTIVVLTALAGASQQSPQPTQVPVIVVDARTGLPLAGVLVTLDAEANAIETDADGRVTLSLVPGRHTLTVGLVGYAVLRHVLEVPAPDGRPVRIALAEGAGGFEEHVSVAGVARGAEEAPAAATLHGRELQALRGVTLDDPLRALHALPSVAATDDFYSEFSVRGLGFRHTGLVVDGIPSRYLMHAVHGVSDGGSIAMVNSDAVASLSLMPGSYPQRIGGHLGAQVDLALREGSRDRFRARAGLSGTSATLLGEGPLGTRGSWLASARRSYLDLLLKRIDDENNLAFGFTDTQVKIVFDVTPRHHLEGLLIGGTSAFEEDADDLAPNDEARVNGRSWLSAFTWRYAPSASFALTQRIYSTGLSYDNLNVAGDSLDDSRQMDGGWRGDAAVALRPVLRLDFGGDARRLTGRRTLRRALSDAAAVTTLSAFDETTTASSAYAQVAIGPWRRVTLTPGVRADRWSSVGITRVSPWIGGDVRVAEHTSVRAGAGLYRQPPDIEQVHGLRGGGPGLEPETARHVDLGLTQALPLGATLQATAFTRQERDVLWTPGSEPRRAADGAVVPGRGDAPWANALDGDARGVEVVLRRDAPAGLTGWAGYAYTRLRYTSERTSETFWSDNDQRHALSLFGHYRLSSRSSVGAKFRYGSNYPRLGYVAEAPPPSVAPPLLGGDVPLFFALSAARNTLRLPAYARLDLRVDRTFAWSGRRMTLFVEVANLLNRDNLRNVPYGVDRTGRVFGGTDSLIPILPSAGFVIEF